MPEKKFWFNERDLVGYQYFLKVICPRKLKVLAMGVDNEGLNKSVESNQEGGRRMRE